MSTAELMAVVREPDATWVIPSEDEWYKAAYHDGSSGVYYDYPTGTDNAPSNDLSNPGNGANYWWAGAYTIGPPYWRTEVGAFVNSQSPYDTFDQGGNVFEWNEAVIGLSRGSRGGSFADNGLPGFPSYLHAWYRLYLGPTAEFEDVGFRVAEVPGQPPDIPTVSQWGLVVMVMLLLIGATTIFARRRTPIAAQ